MQRESQMCLLKKICNFIVEMCILIQRRWHRKKAKTKSSFCKTHQPSFLLISTKEWHRHQPPPPLFIYPQSPPPRPPHPQIFWLITPNVILIKNAGVKGFSLPEKRVQIAAQWQTPPLAWEEMHPDIVHMMPSDQSQIRQKDIWARASV